MLLKEMHKLLIFVLDFIIIKLELHLAEVMSPQGAGFASPSQMGSQLSRGWEGCFEWTSDTSINPPFYVRVTSIFNGNNRIYKSSKFNSWK